MRITVDFDGTLTREDVQRYVEELRSRKISATVITSRYGFTYKDKDGFGYEQNKDLFDKVEGLGFSKEDVYFTNGDSKKRLIRMLKPVLHLENSSSDIDDVMKGSSIASINVNKIGWQSEANFILGIR